MTPPEGAVVTVTFIVCANGDIHEDVCPHGNFGEVYKAFIALRAEIDRQITDRRKCPFNPATIRRKGEPNFDPA